MAGVVVDYKKGASELKNGSVPDKMCFLIGTPQHTNIGDRAIAYAEIEFLKDKISGQIVEVPFGVNIDELTIRQGDTIVLHGGGNLGDIWPEEENYRRDIIEKYQKNKIVLMPQTMYFESPHELAESVRIYSLCTDLTMVAREKTTYDEMRRRFSENNVILIPDIVMYLRSKNNLVLSKREYALFVTRDDKERVISDDYIYRSIKKLVADKDVKDFVFSDMHVGEIEAEYNSHRFIVEQKLDQFKKAKIVITDRLHGMIFALLTGTPCIVFGSKTHKTYGVYEWIRRIGGDEFIKLCQDVEEIESLIGQLRLDKRYRYTHKRYNKRWRMLEGVIKAE